MKYIMLQQSSAVKVFNDDFEVLCLIYQIGFLEKYHVMIHCID